MRVEVDIVYKKAFGALGLPGLYTPQGAENDKMNVIGQGTNVKQLIRLL